MSPSSSRTWSRGVLLRVRVAADIDLGYGGWEEEMIEGETGEGREEQTHT